MRLSKRGEVLRRTSIARMCGSDTRGRRRRTIKGSKDEHEQGNDDHAPTDIPRRLEHEAVVTVEEESAQA